MACFCPQIWKAGGLTIHMCNQTQNETVKTEDINNTPSSDLPGPSSVASFAGPSSSSPSFAEPSSSFKESSPSSSFKDPSPSFAEPSSSSSFAEPSSRSSTHLSFTEPSSWDNHLEQGDVSIFTNPSPSGVNSTPLSPAQTKLVSFEPLYLLLLAPLFCLLGVLWWKKKRSCAVSPRDVKLREQKPPVSKSTTVQMENPAVNALRMKKEVDRTMRLMKMLQQRTHNLPPLPPPEESDEEGKVAPPPPSLFILTNSEEEDKDNT